MPNRYIPSALAQMIDEKYDEMVDLDEVPSQEAPPEHEALIEMLQPEFQQEYRERVGGAHG